MISFIKSFVSPRLKLAQQQRELQQLRKDLAIQQAQNASMREGMRRCTSCEYRLAVKPQQQEINVRE